MILALTPLPATTAQPSTSGLQLTRPAHHAHLAASFAQALVDASAAMQASDKTPLMLAAWAALLDAVFAQIASTAHLASRASSWTLSPRSAQPALDHALLVDLSEPTTAQHASLTPYSMLPPRLASAADLSLTILPRLPV